MNTSTSRPPKQDSSRSSTFTGLANTHGGQTVGIPSPQILAPILFLLLFLLSCSNSDTSVRHDIERPCYDECVDNKDCAEGLACSEQAGNVCIPIRCIECWAAANRTCMIDEDYSDGADYPVCTYVGCNE